MFGADFVRVFGCRHDHVLRLCPEGGGRGHLAPPLRGAGGRGVEFRWTALARWAWRGIPHVTHMVHVVHGALAVGAVFLEAGRLVAVDVWQLAVGLVGARGLEGVFDGM